MTHQKFSSQEVELLIKQGERLPFAMENYPSRGQTTVQELYQTKQGKFFLKRVSERNHDECQIDIGSGTLAEREYWAYRLADKIGFFVPPMWLIGEHTTVQRWLDYPDGKTFKKSTGRMEFSAINIFECVVFDWITGQVDRHDANYLYNYADRLVIPVDSAHAFLKYEGALPDYLHLFEVGQPKELNRKINSRVKAKLDDIELSVLHEIVPLRNIVELNALKTRKEMLRGAGSIQDILNLYRSKR